MKRRFGGPQSRSGCFGEKEKLLSLPRIEPQFLTNPAHSLRVPQHIWQNYMGHETRAEFLSTMFVWKHFRLNNLHPVALDRLTETSVILQSKYPLWLSDLHQILSRWTVFFSQVYICSSVHRNSRLKKSNKMQQYADIYLLLNYSTCFGRPSRPSSGVHKTVVAASGTYHTIWEAPR